MALRRDCSSTRPALVDFSDTRWDDAPTVRATRRRTAPATGAIRLSLDPGVRRHRQLLKVTAALMFATAGVLMATTSTGTVAPRPALPVALASVQPPDFFFGDRHDALGEPGPTRTGRKLPGVAPTGTPSRITPPSAASFVDPSAPVSTTGDVAGDIAHVTVPAAGIAASGAGASPNTTTRPVATEHPSLDAARARATADETTDTVTIEVASGDTLSGILLRHGVRADRMNRLLGDPIVEQQLTSLRIGQKLALSRYPRRTLPQPGRPRGQ